ncbi:MAG TPA: CopG family transcriptional regulator [Actinomycetota bacterium]|nr:CopG family transcriptional regulator [Actinomycetota bacterium]
MRTTVTLDPDTEALVKALMHERGLSFKAAINEAIRAGLSRPKAPFRQRSFAMGFQPRVNLDKALQIAAELEDQQILHELSIGK